MILESLPHPTIKIPLERILDEYVETAQSIKRHTHHRGYDRQRAALMEKLDELFDEGYAESGYTIEGDIVKFSGLPFPNLDLTRDLNLEDDRDLVQLFMLLGRTLKFIYHRTLGNYSEYFTQILASIITEYDTIVQEITTDYSDINDLVALRDHYKQTYNVQPTYKVSLTFCTKCGAKSGEELSICPSCGKEKWY